MRAIQPGRERRPSPPQKTATGLAGPTVLGLVMSLAFMAACSASVKGGTTTAEGFSGKAHGTAQGKGSSTGAPGASGENIPRLSWMKDPAPIEGKWSVDGCETKHGMIVEFVLGNPTSAVGRILNPGKASVFGYAADEQIFIDLEPNRFGAWHGKHKWRGVGGVERWDPIYFILEGETLSTTMTTDKCFKKMSRRR